MQARVPQRADHFEIRFLRKISDARTAGAMHFSRRSFVRADDDSQKRGLAYAVGTNERDPRTFRHRETDVGEKVHRAEGFGEGGNSDEGHGRWLMVNR